MRVLRGKFNNIKFRAEFQEFNQKVVKCTLVSSYGIGEIKTVGIAKCNFAAGDQFDRSTGETIALDKALDKFCRKIETRRRTAKRRTDKQVAGATHYFQVKHVRKALKSA